MAEDSEIWAIHEVLEEAPETQTYLVDVDELEATKPDLVKEMRTKAFGVPVTYDELNTVQNARVEPPAMVTKITKIFVG